MIPRKKDCKTLRSKFQNKAEPYFGMERKRKSEKPGIGHRPDIFQRKKRSREGQKKKSFQKQKKIVKFKKSSKK